MMEEQRQILYDSDEAATFKTDVSGWVDSHGHFFGTDEDTARYFGCTHRKCKACGKITGRYRPLCAECIKEEEIAFYQKKERLQWDGKIPLYSEKLDKFIWCADDLEYLQEAFQVEEMRLVICEPILLPEIQDDYGCDELPEEGELPKNVWEAIEYLNEAIRAVGPVSWCPGKYAVKL